MRFDSLTHQRGQPTAEENQSRWLRYGHYACFCQNRFGAVNRDVSNDVMLYRKNRIRINRQTADANKQGERHEAKGKDFSHTSPFEDTLV